MEGSRHHVVYRRSQAGDRGLLLSESVLFVIVYRNLYRDLYRNFDISRVLHCRLPDHGGDTYFFVFLCVFRNTS